MDALRRSLVILLAVTAVICIVPMTSDASDAAGEMDGLMLYEVNPYDNEGVSVYNYGDSPVDLRDYRISDNSNLGSREGYISFTESITVEPDSFVVIATSSGEPNSFVNRDGVEVYYTGTHGIVKSTNFALNNDGDDVYLFKDDTIVDAFCYGKVLIKDPDLWASDVSFDDKDDTIFQRHGTYDTDSEEDWFYYVHGQTQEGFNPDLKFDATVTPFLFPDSGGIPVYDAVQSATESLYINVYILSNKNICGLIYEKLTENPELEVDILIEGTPVDGDEAVADCAPTLLALVDAGADVRMIGMGDSARYIQDHAKYAIIDMNTVVVTSENWTTANLNGSIDYNVYSGDDGNRGWGAVIESQEYADYMYRIFQNDFSMSYGDVTLLKDEFPNAKMSIPWYDGHGDADFDSYQAQITPILSNDNSFDFTEYFINYAKERLYAEQQSLNGTYQEMGPESPLGMMAGKANDGVDCRLIFGTGVDNYNTVEKNINGKSLIMAGVLTTPYVHNKGIVSDDVAIVSSVNWTPSSFFNNREVAVAIYSQDIADYFAQAFMNDFNQCYDYDGFKVDISEIKSSYESGETATFTVTVSPEGEYEYLWDFGDGKDPVPTKIPRIAYEMIASGDGESRVLTVTVTNADGDHITVTKTYFVGTESTVNPPEPEEPTDPDNPGETVDQDDRLGDIGQLISDNLYILIPLIVIILGAIAAVGRSGKKRSSKKRK